MSDEPSPSGTTDALRHRLADDADLLAVEDVDVVFDTVRRVKRRLLSLWEVYDTVSDEQVRLRNAGIEPPSWSQATTTWVGVDDARTLVHFVDPAEVRAAAAMLDGLSEDLTTLRLIDDPGFREAWEHTVLHLAALEEVLRHVEPGTAPDFGLPEQTADADADASSRSASGSRGPAYVDLTETLFTWMARRVRADGIAGAKSVVLAGSTSCDALSRRLARLQDHGLRVDLSDAELGEIEDRVRVDLLEQRVDEQAREIELLRKLVFELNEERRAQADSAERRRSWLLGAETSAPEPGPPQP